MLIFFSGSKIFNYVKFNSFMIKMFSIGGKIDALWEKNWAIEFTLLTLPYQYKITCLFLLVFYLVFFFFPFFLPKSRCQISSQDTWMVNSIKFIRGNKINPHKYFGPSQTFNNDREHTSSYSNTNVLASICRLWTCNTK